MRHCAAAVRDLPCVQALHVSDALPFNPTLVGCNECGCKPKGSFMWQAVPPASAKAARLAGDAAVRAAQLAAVEDLLWGAHRAAAAWQLLGRARRAKSCPTLAQRLARRAAAVLAVKFAVELEDVRVLLSLGQPGDADRVRTGGGVRSLDPESNPGAGSKGKPGGSAPRSRGGGAEPHPGVALDCAFSPCKGPWDLPLCTLAAAAPARLPPACACWACA